MDEKTESLRDLFIDATGSDTVTESQEESRGSLADRDEEATTERVRELVATMRDRYGFSTALSDGVYEAVVRAYFDETIEDDETVKDDAAIAAAVGNGDDPGSDDSGADDSGADDGTDIDAATVRDVRLDLHLVTDADRDAPFEYAELKRLLAADRSVTECATALGVDSDTVERYADVARADAESTRANGRFRDEFRALLTDADIEESHASDAREDGLRDATEDIETDVSL